MNSHETQQLYHQYVNLVPVNSNAHDRKRILHDRMKTAID